MLRILLNGRSGLKANQNRLDIIFNNIANVETNGYKSADVSFEDIFYEKMDSRLGMPLTGNQEQRKNAVSGSGSKADKIVRDYTQGIIEQTGREEDLAVEGNGYFRVKDQSGKLYYTRDGAFNIDKDGNLVNSSGMILDIQNYDPSKLKRPITINENGEIHSSEGYVGKVNLYDFTDKEAVLPCGNNLFEVPENSNLNVRTVQNSGEGSIKQGFLEKSNVDMTKQLTDMMVTQRAFELNSRSIKAADEMWQIANNLRSK